MSSTPTPATITAESIVVASEDLMYTQLVDEVTVLDQHRGIYYSLNSMGTAIWALIQQPVLVSAVHDALLAEYDIAPDRLEKDLLGFFAELARLGLVAVQAPVLQPNMQR